MEELKIGNIVTSKYKTGRYVGEVIDIQPTRVLVKILAVLKHPTQGDLHAPKQTDVAHFHTRKALAYLEKAWMPTPTVSSYEGSSIPSYSDSLIVALRELEEGLRNSESDFAKESLKRIQELKEDYQLSK